MDVASPSPAGSGGWALCILLIYSQVEAEATVFVFLRHLRSVDREQVLRATICARKRNGAKGYARLPTKLQTSPSLVATSLRSLATAHMSFDVEMAGNFWNGCRLKLADFVVGPARSDQ